MGKHAHHHVLYEIPEGNPHCDILFIGEAPGRSEDIIGRPFIGSSGKFLRELIAETLTPKGLTFGLANLLACRPRDKNDKDRPPVQEEIFMCQERLKLVIKLASPFTIVNLGKVPTQYLPEIAQSAGYRGYIFNLYHPSFLLRSGRTSSPYYKGWIEQLRKIVKVTGDARYIDENTRRNKWAIKGTEVIPACLPPKTLKAKVKKQLSK